MLSKTRHQLSCTRKHRRSSSKGFGRYTHSLILRATNGRLGILVRATVFVPGNATHLNFKYCIHPLGSGRYKDWLHVADSLRHLSVSFPRLLENDSSSYFHVNHTTMSTASISSLCSHRNEQCNVGPRIICTRILCCQGACSAHYYVQL